MSYTKSIPYHTKIYDGNRREMHSESSFVILNIHEDFPLQKRY